MSVKHLYLAAVLAALGCMSSPNPPSPSTGIPRSSTVITADEMAETHADLNSAYDAVARLRPNWLAPHGVTSTGTSAASTETATVWSTVRTSGASTRCETFRLSRSAA